MKLNVEKGFSLNIFSLYLIIYLIQQYNCQYISVKNDVNVLQNLKGKKLFIQGKENSLTCNNLACYQGDVQYVYLKHNGIIRNLKVNILEPNNENIVNFSGAITFLGDIIWQDYKQSAVEEDESDANNGEDGDGEQQQLNSEDTNSNKDLQVSNEDEPKEVLKQDEQQSIEKQQNNDSKVVTDTIKQEEDKPKEAQLIQKKHKKRHPFSQTLIETKQIHISQVKQWLTIDTENFNFKTNQMTRSPENWQLSTKNLAQLQSVDPQSDDNEKMMVAKYGETMFRNFTNLPEHDYLKIEANFYFLSPFWKGEEAIIKVDNKVVWMDRHNWQEQDNNICFMDENRIKDYQWNYPLNIVVKHRKKNAMIEVLINSKSLEHSDCSKQNIALFGFDDFNLSYK